MDSWASVFTLNFQDRLVCANGVNPDQTAQGANLTSSKQCYQLYVHVCSNIGGFNMLNVHKQTIMPRHDFQQCGILTSVDSDESVQPFKLRNSKWCSVSSLTLIEYSSNKQRL